MKKYTIKEFAEGKKAVKIENEEQWSKLNKVHKLTIKFYNSNLYTNQNTYNGGRQFYIDCGYELLEFSQLDFEDEFVVGKWYKRTEKQGYHFEKDYLYFVKGIKNKNIVEYTERIDFGGSHSFLSDFCDSNGMIETDLSEIQQYLPSNHPDLIKKDTFVLPEKWCVFSDQNKIITDWFDENQTGSYNMKQLVRNNLLFCYPAVEKWIYLGNPHSCTRSVKPHNYTEITFEQFKTYVLKEKTMEKEIIGYKLVKPKYEMASIKLLGWNLTTKLLINISEKGDIHRLKEAGVLDLWFEKVYAPEFKVGDWCFTNQFDSGTFKILKIEGDKIFNMPRGWVYLSKGIRLATPEEIKAAQIQLPTIDGYQGYYESGIIKYGCAEFMDSFFINLDLHEKLGSKQNRSINSIELSSGVKITKEQIKQIVEYINNNK